MRASKVALQVRFLAACLQNFQAGTALQQITAAQYRVMVLVVETIIGSDGVGISFLTRRLAAPAPTHHPQRTAFQNKKARAVLNDCDCG